MVYGNYQNENAQNDNVFRRKKGFPFLNSKLNEREKRREREREGCTEEAGGNKVLQEGGHNRRMGLMESMNWGRKPKRIPPYYNGPFGPKGWKRWRLREYPTEAPGSQGPSVLPVEEIAANIANYSLDRASDKQPTLNRRLLRLSH